CVVPLATGDQVVPSQCSTWPCGPTAHTSFAAAPQTSLSESEIPEAAVHIEPSKCTTAPNLPTAQTSQAETPQMLRRSPVVALSTSAHPVPFQCMMMPAAPTIHTLVAEVPHTPRK